MRLRRPSISVVAGVVAALWSAPSPVSAQASRPSAEPRGTYAIAPAPLDLALLELGIASGLDVLYENGVVDGKLSSGASGELTLQQAIGQVLEGTGLQFRFTSLSAVLIFPADRPPGPAEAPWTAIESAPKLTLDTLTVTSSPTIGDSSRRRFEAFGSAIQGQIRHRLQTDVRTRRRTFQVRLSLTVDPSGRIRLLNIARSTGDVELDQHILDALAGVAFPQTPPADLPQPIWFDVASR